VPTPLAGVVIDCARPRHLAAFWTEVTGYGIAESEDDWVMLVPPEGAVTIGFQKVPEPKVVKNRVHLDIRASGGPSVPLATRRERVDAAVARLLALGATTAMVHDVDGLDHYAVTMQDPEGNEFCVCDAGQPER
jgi:hypothetical protein